MHKVKEVQFYTDSNGKCYIQEWLNSLTTVTRNRIIIRLTRLECGHYGDYKRLDSDLFELRFFFDNGYRIYYCEENNHIILLLTSGTKDSQNKDIKKAKYLYSQFKEGHK